MENKLLLKRKFFIVLISIIIFSCTKDKKANAFYDKVEYYHSNYYKIAGPPDGTERFNVYYSDFVEKNSKIYYEDLSQFRFVKSEINNEFSDKIDNFFTDQNQGRYYPDFKCLNCYQDVFLFYKNKELVGIAKFDFKCNKYCYTNFELNKDRYLSKDCLQYKYLFK